MAEHHVVLQHNMLNLALADGIREVSVVVNAQT